MRARMGAVIAATVITAVLTACGEDGEEQASGAESTAETSSTTGATSPPPTVTGDPVDVVDGSGTFEVTLTTVPTFSSVGPTGGHAIANYSYIEVILSVRSAEGEAPFPPSLQAAIVFPEEQYGGSCEPEEPWASGLSLGDAQCALTLVRGEAPEVVADEPVELSLKSDRVRTNVRIEDVRVFVASDGTDPVQVR